MDSLVVEVAGLSEVGVDHLADGCCSLWELDGFGLQMCSEPLDLGALARSVKAFDDDEKAAFAALRVLIGVGVG